MTSADPSVPDRAGSARNDSARNDSARNDSMSADSKLARLAPFAPYVIVSLVHVGLILAQGPLIGPTKLILMPLLALAAIWAAARIAPWPRGAMAMLLVAIVCSWLGDGAATFFPMFDDELPMMLLCFGLAHVAYVLLMWRGRDIARGGFPRWALVYVAAYAVLMWVLVPHTGALAVPVVLYGLLLVATAAFASRCGAVIAWGGVWFLVSDAILAFRIFVPEAMPDWTSGTVMLTYTLGQGLLVFGIVSRLRERTQRAAAGASAEALHA